MKVKTVQDILSMDRRTFNRLSESEKRQVVGKMSSAANKRLKRFEETGTSSPATRAVEKSGGKFSTKGKDINQLRAEYIRAKNFLQSKTSTATSYGKVQEDTTAALRAAGVDISPDQLDKVMKTYEELKETDPIVATRGMKYRVLNEISILSDKVSTEDVLHTMQDRLSELYEEEQEIMGGDDFDVSDFFEV